MHSVEEAFELLKLNKITTNKESVRRWLRQGVIKGIAPSSKKEGWIIPEDNLNEFIRSRLPDSYATNDVKETNATNVVKGEIEKGTRAEMWFELAKKGIWEGFIEIKKSQIRECVRHRKYPEELAEKVWEACVNNSKAYKKPRVTYLLEAFAFGGKRLFLDKKFESLEEQIVFPLIEYVRKSKLN